jgi:CheY-like chemotaxis protein
MRVFVLEDSKVRFGVILNFWKKFASFEGGASYTEAIKSFDLNYKYDLIMLDHDLGGEEGIDIKESNTGTNFVKWIGKNYQHRDVPIIIHSHNPIGSEHMHCLLTEFGFFNVDEIPFGTLVNLWNQGVLNFLGHYKYDEV